jgi:hypothetical protein
VAPHKKACELSDWTKPEKELKATSFSLIMKESVLHVDWFVQHRVKWVSRTRCGQHLLRWWSSARTLYPHGHGTNHCRFVSSCSNPLWAESTLVIMLAQQPGLILPFSAPCQDVVDVWEGEKGWRAPLAWQLRWQNHDQFPRFSCTSDIRSFMNIYRHYIYIYICIYFCICMYIYIYICMYVCMHGCM